MTGYLNLIPDNKVPFGHVDLSIKKFWADDTSLSFGQTLQMRLHVANDGTQNASNVKTIFYWSETPAFDFSTAVRIDADGHGTLKAGELDTNEHETIKYKTLAKLGSGYVFGVIDAEGKTRESDETNNVSEGVFVELNGGNPHLADLKIETIWAEDATLEFGQDLVIHQHVSNTGTADAKRTKTTYYWSEEDAFDFSTAVRIDADGHGTLKAGELDTNEHETIKYKSLAKLGSGYVFGVIDAEGKTSESDETNNVSEGVFVELNGGNPHLADLKIAEMSVDDASLELGQSLIVRLHVQNEGTANAKSVDTTFYWSPTDHFDFNTAVEVDNDSHGTLKIGEYDNNEYEHIRYSDLRDLGSGYVIGVIDAHNVIAEENEANNISQAVEFMVL